MKDNLKITIIQSELHWENAEANRNMFSDKIDAIETGTTDLILLPEMFTTGFSMNAEKLAEETKGETFSWMVQLAKKKNAAIAGSIITKEKGLFYNRLFFVLPDGSYKTYDKKHCFTLAKEHETYTPGTERLIVEYKGWKICPLICYDLRFPVWARNTENYDLLLYLANWPKTRVLAWDTLLRARAIENMAYCIGVNRTGKDGNDFEYTGHSAAYDVLGTHVSTSNYEEEFIQTITLTKDNIDSNRNHLQFLNDRDRFTLR